MGVTAVTLKRKDNLNLLQWGKGMNMPFGLNGYQFLDQSPLWKFFHGYKDIKIFTTNIYHTEWII